MARKLKGKFIYVPEMASSGLTVEILRKAMEHTHSILDEIDDRLLSVGADRLSQTVELANLSSMVGNILGAGIEANSNSIFKKNGPHKFPDILSNSPFSKDIEIKISLETNKPKGHLAKPGYYLTCRYVLIYENGIFNINERGSIVEIWEARFGYLEERHFNLSNTPGDSGKTAVINKEGMEKLTIVYANANYCPYSNRSITFKNNYSKFV